MHNKPLPSISILVPADISSDVASHLEKLGFVLITPANALQSSSKVINLQEENLHFITVRFPPITQRGADQSQEVSMAAFRRLANECGNLMMSIQNEISYIEDAIDDNNYVDEHIAHIRAAIERSSDWLKDIDILALEEVELEPLNLHKLIDNVILHTIPTFPSAVDFHARLADDLWPVVGNQDLLKIALKNIMVNGAEAISGNGELLIEATNVKIPSSLENVIHSGDYVRITIIDTGTGISTALVDKIFEPFFTTKKTSHFKGLGLSQTKAIINKHQGILDLKSTIGKGSVFTIILPRSKSLVNETAIPFTPSAHVELPPSNFLVVDDDPGILLAITRTLEGAGHQTICIEEGLTAIDIFEQQKDDINQVILDINLKDMSGFEVHEKLIEINPEIQIILCTGYADPDKLSTFAKRPTTQILRKPFRGVELLELITVFQKVSTKSVV